MGMSAVTVSMCRLVCDTCGTARDSLTLGAISARIEAAAEGWKFAQYDVKGKGLQKRIPDPKHPGSFSVDATPKQWDSCPGCPLPSAVEAKAVADSRKTVAI